MPDTCDIVIIGGGHNGLVTAFYLATAGFKPLVLERRNIAGGWPMGWAQRSADTLWPSEWYSGSAASAPAAPSPAVSSVRRVPGLD